MSLLLGWVIFVAALLISIMLHEAGHFVTAKRFHMKVTQFFVGFGHTLWSRTRGETEYGVKALPFGGFVKITGMTALEDVNPADEERSFRRQPAWQRAVVLGAGSFRHFVLAFILLIVLAVGIGLVNDNSTKIGTVSACIPTSVTAFDNGTCQRGAAVSPAKAAGVREGDKIVAIGSTRVRNWTQLGAAIKAQPEGRPVSITVLRDGRQLVLHATRRRSPAGPGPTSASATPPPSSGSARSARCPTRDRRSARSWSARSPPSGSCRPRYPTCSPRTGRTRRPGRCPAWSASAASPPRWSRPRTTGRSRSPTSC